MRKIFLAVALTFLTITSAFAWELDGKDQGVELWVDITRGSSDTYRYEVRNYRDRIVCVFIWMTSSNNTTNGFSGGRNSVSAVVPPRASQGIGSVYGNTQTGYTFSYEWAWAERGNIDCP